MVFLAPIVEGQGEVTAVPVLLNRLAYQGAAFPGGFVVNNPIRIKLYKFINDEEYFFKYCSLAAAKAAKYQGHVLIILDCDDACPAQLGPALQARAEAVRGDVSWIVALAHREFESWFLAAAPSLAGCCGLPSPLEAPDDPASLRDAKGWLSHRMADKYDPIRHQARMCACVDLDMARRSPSFDRLCRKLVALFGP